MKVEIKNLKKYFGKSKAVDDISFSFESGNVFGFVGPNGAGKTTTMRIMTNLEDPTEGDVLIDGFSAIENPEESRKLIGFMPDSIPVYSDITVFEYLDFYARSFGLRGKHKKAATDSTIEFTGLGNMLSKALNSLSKGMLQRVSLGRAMIHDPDILILDEPAAGLDPRARVELRELLGLLSEQNKAVLISSHILTELSEICNGVVIIEKGRILETGTIDQIINKTTPQKRYAIKCIGDTKELYEKVLQLPNVLDAVFSKSEVCIELGINDEMAIHNILKSLIESGCMVTEFHNLQEDLEDIFMKVTKGELQ